MPGRRPPRPFVVVLIAATAFALFALVAVNVMIGQTGIVRAELQTRVSEKRTAVEQAELDVMQLSSPARIAAKARKLGLVPAQGAIVLAPSKTPDVRGPSPVRGRP